MIVLIMKNDSNLENVALAVQHLENVAAIIVKDTPWVSVSIVVRCLGIGKTHTEAQQIIWEQPF